MKKSLKAFTLIELLVVIAIIGILATISVLALSNARAKSRDAKRAGDMKQVQTALELFFNDNNRYPTTAEWNTGKIYSTSTGSTSTYMQVIPTAPTPADGACSSGQNTVSYFPADDGSSYSISFCLGNTTGTLTPGPKCLTPSGIVNIGCTLPEVIGDSFSCPGLPVVQYEGGNYDYNGLSTSTGGYYRTVQVGGQCWMRDNLNVGTRVESTQNQGDYSGGIQKYCYNNDASSECATYGGLYQWHMIAGKNQSCDSFNCTSDPSNVCCTVSGNTVCPNGWHVPTDAEWTVLYDYLSVDGQGGSGTDAGYKLKSNTAWSDSSTNSSGFSALPSGIFYVDGSFYNQGSAFDIWSTSVIDSSSWVGFLLTGDLVSYHTYGNRAAGYSVRCLKD